MPLRLQDLSSLILLFCFGRQTLYLIQGFEIFLPDCVLYQFVEFLSSFLIENYEEAFDCLLKFQQGKGPEGVRDGDVNSIFYKIADQVLVIDSEHYGRVEDAHMGICHMLCYAFMEGAA